MVYIFCLCAASIFADRGIPWPIRLISDQNRGFFLFLSIHPPYESRAKIVQKLYNARLRTASPDGLPPKPTNTHTMTQTMNQTATHTNSNSSTHAMKSENDRKQRLELNKLHKRLRRHVGQAIAEYNMIEEGDKVMVCVSGGKDSYAMLDILLNLQKSAPVKFELVAVNMDQKQPGFPEEVLPNYLESLGVPYYIVEKDTYSVVKSLVPEGKTTCGVCSRLRRGTLYGFAEEIGATKVALGHHKDDIVETLFLNMFHGGRLKAMPPKLLSDDKRNIIIRPMAFCRESDIERYAVYKQFPIIPCNLCGSQENLQRQSVKAMLQQWDKDTPGRTDNIFSAISKISPSQLADKNLFDFTDLAIDRVSEEKKPLQFEDNKTVSSGNMGHLSAVEQWVGAEDQEKNNSIQAINL